MASASETDNAVPMKTCEMLISNSRCNNDMVHYENKKNSCSLRFSLSLSLSLSIEQPESEECMEHMRMRATRVREISIRHADAIH